MEDNVLAKRWAEGTFTLDSILAYSAVCAGGVDTVPLPGDVTEDQIARILGDVAWLAYRWNKRWPPSAAGAGQARGRTDGVYGQRLNPDNDSTVARQQEELVAGCARNRAASQRLKFGIAQIGRTDRFVDFRHRLCQLCFLLGVLDGRENY